MNGTIDSATLRNLRARLEANEKRPATVEKYHHDAAAFALWLGEGALTREAVGAWRDGLLAAGLSPRTVNGKLAAVTALLKLLGREDCRVRTLKVQRRVFRDPGRELTRSEYERLVSTAEGLGKTRLALLIETICSTGIRVSEVKYLTVEAADRGQAVIDLKGKLRTVLLPGKLRQKLRKYAKKQKIATGPIFRARTGKPLCRRQIWAEMKALCQKAGVAPGKVFPHNLRHLFAVTFFRVCRDIGKLADVLGHSSIETTRVYLMTSGEEHRRYLDRLRLVS